jgi:NodT family efflux transporter outer membrane factor (OMF) lipoprotein
MKKFKDSSLILTAFILLFASGCIPALKLKKKENRNVPSAYRSGSRSDTTNSALIKWKDYFKDDYLTALIDTALKNNQDLNMMLQEIEVSRNEVRARKGEYLPFVGIEAGGGAEREARYTRTGAVDDQLQIAPGKAFPSVLGNMAVGFVSTWELDVWGKLRNAKKAAAQRYAASIEGRNFMVTRLVAEIANSYYELMGLDNQLFIVQQNIEIQKDALDIIRQEKDAAKVTQLAVNRFDAQLLHTQNLQYEILQRITETENRINFLLGRFPQPIQRNSAAFYTIEMDTAYMGLPAQLLSNRTDIRQAERELLAARLDLKSAKAAFYPSFRLSAGVGIQAFNPSFIFRPESILFNFIGGLTQPLVNRNALKASYLSSGARQNRAVYRFEQTVLNAFNETDNQIAAIRNYTRSFQTKQKEVEILTKSVPISTSLFRSARADYMEVLLTQREVLESRMELTEIKTLQLHSRVNFYQALGGGWK